MNRPQIMSLAAWAAAILVGCGSDAGPSAEEQAVERAVEKFASAVIDGNSEKACDAMTAKSLDAMVDALNRSLEADGAFIGCAQAVEGIQAAQAGREAIAEMDTLIAEDALVTTVEVRGERATATIGDEQVSVRLQKGGPDWLIADPTKLMFGLPPLEGTPQ